MFARWRTLAAAGAMWASYALGSQATPSDNSETVPVSICACRLGPEGPTAQPIYENEYWYERYYRNYWGEASSDTNNQEDPAAEPPATTEDEYGTTDSSSREESSIDAAGQCSDPTCPCHDEINLDLTDDQADDASDADGLDSTAEPEAATEFNESFDSTECLEPCDGLSCPCQEILNDNAADEATEQTTEAAEPDYPANWQNIVEEPAPSTNVEIYEPYSYRSNQNADQYADDEYGHDQTGDPIPAFGSEDAGMVDEAAPLGQEELDNINLRNDGIDDGAETAPEAQLSGTIEPESDAAGDDRTEPEISEGDEAAPSQDAEWNDGAEAEMIQDESSDEAAESNESATDEQSAESNESTTDDPAPESEETSTVPAPKFHMFYPGCDWSPYYPSDDAPDSDAIDESLESTQPTSLRLSIAPFPGSIWLNQAAVSVVTWTGKLAEQVGNLIAESSVTLND